MKQDGVVVQTKQKIIGLLLTLFPTAKIYLYGSRARGTQREFSDIDLAIDAGKSDKPLRLGEVRSILEATNIPYKIDLVDLNFASPALKNAILQEGVLWNPENFCNKESTAECATF